MKLVDNDVHKLALEATILTLLIQSLEPIGAGDAEIESCGGWSKA